MKQLESDSKLNPYDFDNDGIVTDAEIDKAKEIREFEDKSRKHLAQLRLARYSLIAIGIYTLLLFMPFIPDERIAQITKISDLFYISLCSVVGAYMGFTSWASRK
tara:strand:+ start:2099 stop:2413 length:315 start_codon:yes stop_codon:yes gene_type:complete